jgi:hypothetical protein
MLNELGSTKNAGVRYKYNFWGSIRPFEIYGVRRRLALGRGDSATSLVIFNAKRLYIENIFPPKLRRNGMTTGGVNCNARKLFG